MSRLLLGRVWYGKLRAQLLGEAVLERLSTWRSALSAIAPSSDLVLGPHPGSGAALATHVLGETAARHLRLFFFSCHIHVCMPDQHLYSSLEGFADKAWFVAVRPTRFRCVCTVRAVRPGPLPVCLARPAKSHPERGTRSP